MSDVIIIGAGYAGLSTAALLAYNKCQVLVIEKGKLLGGRAAGHRDPEGFYREYGVHTHRLAEEGPANSVFKAMGERIDFVPSNHPAAVFYNGRLYPRPESPATIIKSKMLSWPAKLQLVRVMIKLATAKPEQWFAKSLLEFYREKFKPKREVEDFLNLLSFMIMVPRAEYCSAGEFIDFVKIALKAKRKVSTPVGGSAQEINKLVKIIKANGDIHAGEEVREIIIKDHTAIAVKTDQNVYEARSVVFAAPLDQLLSLVPTGRLAASVVEYAKKIEHTTTVILEFMSDEPIANLDMILGVGLPLLAHFPTHDDPSLAPPGKHLATFSWMLDRGKGQDPAALADAEQKIRDCVETMFPGYKNKVKSERKVVVKLQNGALLCPAQSRPFRPGVDASGVSRLYLAGDTVNGEGVSGDIAFSSALKVSQLILQELPK